MSMSREPGKILSNSYFSSWSRQVPPAADALELHALPQQVLVDVDEPRAGKDLVELVLLELVEAGAAGHDHGADVEVVERVREAVKEHAVGGDDALAALLFPRGGLRVAAAQVPRRQ